MNNRISIYLFLIVISFSCSESAKESMTPNVPIQDTAEADSLTVIKLKNAYKQDTVGDGVIGFELLSQLLKDSVYINCHDSIKYEVFNGLVKFSNKSNNYQNAVQYIDSALLYSHAINIKTRNKRIAGIYSRKSHYCSRLMNRKECLSSIKLAISHYSKVDSFSEHTLGIYYSNASDAFGLNGDMAQSKEYILKALELLDKNSFPYAASQAIAGNYYYTVGDYESAKPHIALSIETFNKVPHPPEYLLNIKLMRMQIYLKSNSYEQNKKEMVELLKSAENVVYAKKYILEALVELEIANEKYDNAKKYEDQHFALIQALSTSETNIDYAKHYNKMGLILSGEGKYEEALKNDQKSITSLFYDFKEEDYHVLPPVKNIPISNAYVNLMVVNKINTLWKYYKATDDDTILEETYNTMLVLDSLGIEMRKSFNSSESVIDWIRQVKEQTNTSIMVSLRLFKKTSDRKYLEMAYRFASKHKSGVFLDGKQEKSAIDFGIPKDEIKKELFIKKSIDSLATTINELNSKESVDVSAVDQLVKKRLDLIIDYDNIVEYFETNYPKYFQLKYSDNSNLMIDSLVNNLPDSTGVIEYFIGADSLYSFFFSKNNELDYNAQKKPDNFEMLCDKFRRITESDSTGSMQEYEEVSLALYNIILKKQIALLEDNDDLNRLFIIPDDNLLQISFDALLTDSITNTSITEWNSDIPYLLRKYPIGILYTNQGVLNSTLNDEIKTAKIYVGFGLEYGKYSNKDIDDLDSIGLRSDISSKITKLIHSEAEITESADLFSGEIYLNSKATVRNFKTKSPSAHILHVAAHGFVDKDDPLKSGIILSKTEQSEKYILRTSDLYNLKLNANTTILSACHTANGAINTGEGIRSLARAFYYAGSENVTASLWSAPDYSTKEIIVSYLKYIKEGYSKDIALQKAKLDFLDNCEFSKDALPSNWAHLISSGNQDPIKIKTGFSFWN